MKVSEKIAVVGAGIMGLTTAYELLKKGYNVTLFEKDKRIGGMSASFDFDGLMIERYYHFFCKPDTHFFELLKELGIYSHLKWNETKMGFLYEGELFKWENPVNLLMFPRLGPISKIRFGLQVLMAIKRKKWDELDGLYAIQWIKSFIGEKAYNVLWDSLLRLKFHEYRNQLSAAWVWRRLKRVGVSRKNIFTERLGYLDGGVDKLLNEMVKRITEFGGKLYLNSEVTKINIHEKKIKGVSFNGKEEEFDKVVATIPLPYIPHIAPGLPEEVIKKYKKLDNIGVVCVILKLTHCLTKNFWLNINDSSIELPGIIEFSNLNPQYERIVYFPFYLPKTHKDFFRSNTDFIDKVTGYCKKINNNFHESWILGKRVHRYEYAQPICAPGFLQMLPPVITEVEGFYAADTSHNYPEDRSISESIRMGRKLANLF